MVLIVAHQAPLSVGILQARILEWVAIPPPGDLPDPGIEPASLRSLALAGRFFTTSTTATREAPVFGPLALAKYQKSILMGYLSHPEKCRSEVGIRGRVVRNLNVRFSLRVCQYIISETGKYQEIEEKHIF